MTSHPILIACLVLLLCLAGVGARADGMPPGWVGRVGAVDGALELRPAGGEWAPSEVNDPVASGMSVRSAAAGRAVLRGGAVTIALAGASELDFERFDAGHARLVLRRGRIGVHLAALPGKAPPRVDIAIPQGAIRLRAAGDYDITAGDAQTPGRIAVFDGQARFAGNGSETGITAGAAGILSGGDKAAVTAGGAEADDFTGWWRAAASEESGRAPPRRVCAGLTGCRALDGRGSWEAVSGYGAVWFPQKLPDGWAPYRDGHWRWIRPWGWTWVDDMPWGFAPSHYGRWAQFPGPAPETARWGWVPGGDGDGAVYAPAVVAFLGTAGVGLSYPGAGGPAVAWFPLAPGETYWPGYAGNAAAASRSPAGASTTAAADTSRPPADIVNAAYKNRRFATVVPRAVFTGSRAVAPSLIRLPETRLVNAPVLPGSPQIAPPAPATAASSGAGMRRVATVAPAPRPARALPARPAVARGRTLTARRATLRQAVVVSHAHLQRHAGLAALRPRRLNVSRPAAMTVRPAAARSSRPPPRRLRLAAARRR